AEMAIPDEVVALHCDGSPANGSRYRLEISGGEQVHARSVVIATGARYCRLDVANLAEFEGAGVHYWASPLEGRLCGGQEVALVGGGNSAGQAAVYLSAQVAKVWMLVRGDSLETHMSQYLVDRIRGLSNVEVLLQTEVTALEGDHGTLQAIRWRHRPTGQETRRPIRHLFLFIGAEPYTAWLSRSDVTVAVLGFLC